MAPAHMGQHRRPRRIGLPTPDITTLVLEGLIVPERPVSEGLLIKSVSVVWNEIARTLGKDWRHALELNWHQWEEMVAGAYERAGYQVVLTPPMRAFHCKDWP